MLKKHWLIANWKMQLNFQQSLEYVTSNLDELHLLADNDHTIIICPPSIALYPLASVLSTTKISVGGQNCSPHTIGSYTGQTSAQSLRQAGGTFCIVGHAERRTYNHETNPEIAAQCLHVLDHDITPIFCIGENRTVYEQGDTLSFLSTQLDPILELANTIHPRSHQPFLVAYEPVWSIGTGKIPDPEHLESVFSWLDKKLQNSRNAWDWKLLYGGSVTSQSTALFTKISYIDGFLIGSASTNFQEFKKIVHSL